MKGIRFIFAVGVFIVILACSSCRSNRPNSIAIEKFPIDTMDVYKSLIPGDSLKLSKSFQGIPVAYSNDRFVTNDSNVFLEMEIVVLDQNPKIISNLLSFAALKLSDTGFIHTPDSLFLEKYNDLAHKDDSPQTILNKFSSSVKEEFYDEISTILNYGCAFNINIEIYPVFLTEDYVTYCKSAYSYTGGAHGNYSRYLQSYDIKTGEAVSLEEVIKPDKMKDFREVVVKHMAYSYPIYDGLKTVEEYLDSLNNWLGNTNLRDSSGSVSSEDVKKITLDNYPLNNPGLTKEGLVINYEKYFLTPGSDGCPTIVIAYDEIGDCLSINYQAEIASSASSAK